MDVSIIIVNYNTKELTSQCINSIYEKTYGVSFEVILVDNASTDGSREFFERDIRITYIYNNENLGFGRSNNTGAKFAKGKYLFLLNSDTILPMNAIGEFYAYMEKHLDIASCGGNLIGCNGQNVSSHGNFPSLLEDFSNIGFSKLYPKYYRHNIAIAQTTDEGNIDDVKYICGADIFIRKEIFEKFNGFDDDYFMYYEETDLYYRLYDTGYKSVILPNVNIIHLIGQSSNQNTPESRVNIPKFRMMFKSRILFFKKNKPRYQTIFVRLFSLLSVMVRFYKYKSDLFKVASIILYTR